MTCFDRALQVRVGVVKRSKKLKAPVPDEIASRRPAIASKLDVECSWNAESTSKANYASSCFVNDPNKKLPRADVPSGMDAGVQLEDTNGEHAACANNRTWPITSS
jgi:hypothetical protein